MLSAAETSRIGAADSIDQERAVERNDPDLGDGPVTIQRLPLGP